MYGIGTEGDYMEPSDAAAEPCIKLEHTTDPKEVNYNGQNVVECMRGPDGGCLMECLDIEEAKEVPLFYGVVYSAMWTNE